MLREICRFQSRFANPNDWLRAVLTKIWSAQGMDGRPKLVTALDRQQLLDDGHTPIYRGLHGPDAQRYAEEFRTADRPLVLPYGGHHFATSLPVAEAFADSPRSVLTAYLRRDAVVLSDRRARRLHARDIRRAKRSGDTELARLLGNRRVWAALNRVDALENLYVKHAGYREIVVLHRAALFVEQPPPLNPAPDQATPSSGPAGNESRTSREDQSDS
jgi:hypothetical protein